MQAEQKKADAEAKKAAKVSRPVHAASAANFDPLTCPCGSKTKNKYSHVKSEKHKLWMAQQQAQADAVPAEQDPVADHLEEIILDERMVAERRQTVVESQAALGSSSDSDCSSSDESDSGVSEKSGGSQSSSSTTIGHRNKRVRFEPTARENEMLQQYRATHPKSAHSESIPATVPESSEHTDDDVYDNDDFAI